MKKIINIPLDERSYDVIIGKDVINDLGKHLRLLSPKQKSTIIITEDNVAKLHLETVKNILINEGFEVYPVILPTGEATKSFSNVQKLADICLNKHIERNHNIIALGGGVIGDLVGFVASMIRRGCGFIQIPTTLLSQVDSSVGGKTAINTSHGKNLIGAFYQPSLVLADTSFLKTLTDRDYAAGFAEVIKYGLLGNEEFFTFLKENIEGYKNRSDDFLLKIISTSVQMKSDIVVEDEKEKGKRALLNLGHTFGHAYEMLSGYSNKLLHGEAVAIGMVHAFKYSYKNGFCSSKDVSIVEDMINSSSLSVNLKDILSDVNIDDIINAMKQDKKVEDGDITLILANKIGDSFIYKNASIQSLKEFLHGVI